MTKTNRTRGYTLMEVVIYTAILGVVGGVLSSTLISASKIKSRQTASIEVNGQLNFALQSIQRSVMDSSVIDINPGTSTSTLVLKFKDDSLNPTKIYVSDGKLVKKVAQGTPQPLTNDSVVANSVSFLKVSGYSGHDSVQVDLTLSYNTTVPDASFSRSLSSAIARVSAATFDSNLIPGATNYYDIGQTSSTWKDMYLSGKLGIGTTNPNYALEVNGTASSTSLYIGNALGIGTTNPGKKLEINATAAALRLRDTNDYLDVSYTTSSNQALFNLSNPGTAGSNYTFRFPNWTSNYFDVSNGSSIFRVANGANSYFNTGGNVGIGTTNPTSKLMVAGTRNDTVSIANSHAWFGDIAQGPGLAVGNYNSSPYGIWMQGRDIGAAVNYPLVLNPLGGNVGVGTTNPTSALTVNGQIQSLNKSDSLGTSLEYLNSTQYWGFRTGTTGNKFNIDYWTNAWKNPVQITAGDGTNPYILLNSGGGNVGIGTTNPLQLLTVKTGTDRNIQFRDITSGSSYSMITFRNDADSANAIGVINSSSLLLNPFSGGYVGIGTTNPRYMVQIADTSAAISLGGNASSNGWGGVYLLGSNSVNNWLVAQNFAYAGDFEIVPSTTNGGSTFTTPTARITAGATSWTFGSDRRLKENINYFSSGLDDVLNLQPAKFDFINGQKNQVGFIAQDVQKVIPEAVSVINSKDGTLGLQDGFIIPYLVNAIKELNDKNNSLEAEIKSLKKEVLGEF